MPDEVDLSLEPDPDADDPDASDEEAKEDAEDLPADAQQIQAQLAPSVDQAIIVIQELADQQQIEALQLPVPPVENSLEAHPPDRGSPADVTLESIRQVVREELANRRPPGPQTFLNNMSYRYLVAATGLIGAIVASDKFYAILKQAFQQSTTLRAQAADTPDANDDSAAAIRAAWLMDESTFWNLLSGYVARNAPRSYPEQLMFMQFTEDIGQHTMTTKWTWDAAADKLALVTQLTGTITSGGAAAAYAQVPTLQYKGQALPRAVAANTMGLALANWASQQPEYPA